MIGARTLFWLLFGIVLVVAVHFAMDVQSETAPKALRRNALLPAAEKAKVLTVVRKGEPETRLVKGDQWTIEKPYAAEAEQSAVLRLTDALSFAPVMDEMTDAELLRLGRTREDFGLKDPRITIVVGGSASSRGTPVSLGSFTPAGDGVYATVGDAPSVYVASSNVLAAADLDAAAFRRRRVLDIEAEDVVTLDIKNGVGGFVRLARSDAGAWKVAEPRECVASSARIRDFLDALVQLEAQKFVWPMGGTNETAVLADSLLAVYGLLADAAVTVTVKCARDRDFAVGFGRTAGDGQVYALTPKGAIVVVSDAASAVARLGVSGFVDDRVFPVEASTVNAVSIDDGGTSYLVSRNADGVWRLDAPVSALADQQAVNALLDRLLAVKSSGPTQDVVRVSVGTNAEPVLVSRQAVFAGTTPENLRSKVIVALDPKRAKRIVVTDREKHAVAAVFDEDKKGWALERADVATSVDGDAVATLVGSLCPLKALRVMRLKVTDGELGVYGLDKPFRTVAIDLSDKDAIRRNILIGDVTDGGRYATLGASDAVFVISSESAATLLAPIAK